MKGDSSPTTHNAQGLNDIGREAFHAASLIYPDVVVTRLHQSPWLADDSGCRVLLKMESEQAGRLWLPASPCWQAGRSMTSRAMQVTKSFKLRGATNKVGHLHSPSACLHIMAPVGVTAQLMLLLSQVASLPPETCKIVTCSSGNHALAVLHACQPSSTRCVAALVLGPNMS